MIRLVCLVRINKTGFNKRAPSPDKCSALLWLGLVLWDIIVVFLCFFLLYLLNPI